MMAPYCAAFEDEERSPSVVGERHRIQMPHQHIILDEWKVKIFVYDLVDGEGLLSKIWWVP